MYASSIPLNTASSIEIFHRLVSQAAILYSTPEAQQQALREHCAIMSRHAPTVARLLQWDDIATALEQEVQP